MSVFDASTVAELILGLPNAKTAEAEIFDSGEAGAAPDLINSEILHVLRAHERRGLISQERSDAARQTFLDLPITRYPTLTLVARVWAIRHNFTAYDAMYVALAEALGTRLVTADARLAAAARTHLGIEVRLLGAQGAPEP